MDSLARLGLSAWPDDTTQNDDFAAWLAAQLEAQEDD